MYDLRVFFERRKSFVRGVLITALSFSGLYLSRDYVNDLINSEESVTGIYDDSFSRIVDGNASQSEVQDVLGIRVIENPMKKMGKLETATQKSD